MTFKDPFQPKTFYDSMINSHSSCSEEPGHWENEWARTETWAGMGVEKE